MFQVVISRCATGLFTRVARSSRRGSWEDSAGPQRNVSSIRPSDSPESAFKTLRDVTSTSDGAQGEKAELLRTGVPSDQKHGKTCVGSECSPIVEAISDLPPNHACIGWSRCTNLSGTGVCYSDGVVCMAAGGGSMCWRTRPSTCDQRRGSHWLCKWLGVNTR